MNHSRPRKQHLDGPALRSIMPDDWPPYLTPRQVSWLSGFTEKSLESMRYRRQGAAYLLVASRVRYRAADVWTWLEAGAR